MTTRVLAVLAAITIALGLPAGTRLPGGEPERPFTTTSSTPAPGPAVPARPEEDFVPIALAIPHLDVRASVIPVGIRDDASMEVPEDIREVGWYYPTAPRTSERGSTILVGHRDGASDPNGIFRELGKLDAGRVVSVIDTRGRRHIYRVESIASVPDADFPRRAEDLFVTHGAPRLVLLTCGGAYVRGKGGYQSTIVVIATPE